MSEKNNFLIEKLNSTIHSQGLKIDIRDWLDIGSETWGQTPDKVKATAYQIALNLGWNDKGLTNVMVANYKHIDEESFEFTLQELKSLAEQYPVEFEDDNKQKTDITFKE